MEALVLLPATRGTVCLQEYSTITVMHITNLGGPSGIMVTGTILPLPSALSLRMSPIMPMRSSCKELWSMSSLGTIPMTVQNVDAIGAMLVLAMKLVATGMMDTMTVDRMPATGSAAGVGPVVGCTDGTTGH